MTKTEVDLEKTADQAMVYEALQIREELLWLLQKICSMDRQSLAVELGTCNGGTFYALTQIFDKVVTIDVGRKTFPFTMRDADTYLIGNTKDPTLINSVNSEIDFLLIDADHRFEGVSSDFKAWSPKVRKGGLIAFHDINGAVGEDGVKVFWEKITSSRAYKTEQIILNKSLFGIGVLWI